MKSNKIYLLWALLCVIGLLSNTDVFAQAKTPKKIADSTRNVILQERKTRDSITAINKINLQKEIAERHRIADSTKASRIAFRDSVTASRAAIKKEKDAIAKVKNSKKYIKEQEKIKQNRIDSIAYVRAKKADLIKKERKKLAEEIAIQRIAKVESMAKQRKQTADSLAEWRKENLAKIKENRKKITDSIAKVRKVVKDSLAVVKNKRLQEMKKLFKTPEQKQAELAMKEHEKKKSNYSNQKFLKKPWTIERRLYQNTVSRYNYLYNAKKLYTESLLSLQKNNKEDYAKLLSLEDILNTKGATAVGGNMDSIIKKCATSIQIHDPRSYWFDDLYLLMGKAYVMKGETDNAITTFQYIANEYKEKPKKATSNSGGSRKPKVVDTMEKYSIATIENRKYLHALQHQPCRNDALVWLAKTYLQAGAYQDAQTLIGIMNLDPKFPKRLKAEVDLLGAQMYMATNSPAQAITSLQDALKDKSMNKSTKIRVTYLLGQLLAQQDDYQTSNKTFEKVLAMHPNVDMDFYSKLNLAKNAAKMPNADLSKIESMFKTIINDGKYTNYLDKAYLTLGIIQADAKPEKAIASLQKAIEKSKNNKTTNEEAFATLGDLYFKQFDYKPSKIAYDSALVYAEDLTTSRNINIEIRRNLLADLVKELDVISYNDSLLALSKLSKKEQLAIAKKALKADKKKKEKSEAISNAPSESIEPSSNNSTWYFANANMVTQGAKAFELKWGNRPNIDNWSRLAAISATALNKEDETKQKEDAEIATQEDQEEKQDLDKYLSAIPYTEEQMTNCHSSRENALYNASVIYYAGLNDDKKTIEYLELLLKDYPNTSYKSKAFYALYLSNKRMPNELEANRYLALLHTEFPDNALVKLATNPDAGKQKNENEGEVLAYYSATYDIFKDNKFMEVLPRIQYARSKYTAHPLIAKFDLLEAMSTTSLKKYSDARNQLTTLIAKYAGNEEATFAQDILALLNQKDTNGVDSNAVLSQLKPSFAEENKVTKFTYEPNQPHYFMFILKEIDDRISPLKSAFVDFNSIKHSTETIESSLYLIDQSNGIVFYKQFVNAALAKKYLKEIEDNKKIYAVYKNNEYDLAIISENNYNFFKNTRDLQGYLKFYKANYK